MQYLVRAAPALVLSLFVSSGCASGPAPSTPENAQARSPEAEKASFPTTEAKHLACLDLRDHIVDLYANEYVSQQGLMLSTSEQTAFRDGWAEELAKKGTFERFERSCFSGLTPRKYRCGMESKTPGGIVACMKLI